MEKTIIAYCPTMKPFAKTIENSIQEIETVEAASAAQALQMLRGDYVDSVLIGRAAKKRDLSDNSKEKRLLDGITLVYKTKTGVGSDQLSEIPVITYLSESDLGDLKNQFTKISFVSSLDECLTDNLETPVLIDWRDYRDEFELLIPMEAKGKDPRFRAPVLYYKNLSDDVLSKITNIVK